jgi:hypothetical protein
MKQSKSTAEKNITSNQKQDLMHPMVAALTPHFEAAPALLKRTGKVRK